MATDVYDKLRSLQDILSRKFEIEREIEELPRELATKNELLNRLKRSFIDKNEAHNSTTEKIKSLRQRLLEAETTREKYEQQMDLIKTQREYEALDKEIRDASEKEQDLRRELQREDNRLIEMKNNIENEEIMIAQQEEEIKSEQSRIKMEIKNKQNQLKELEEEEREITPELDEEILFKFERIIRSKSGLGIVPVRSGVCTGCFMCLTPQFVNDVRLEQGILFCPYCSRILFYSEEEEEARVFEDVFLDEETGREGAEYEDEDGEALDEDVEDEENADEEDSEEDYAEDNIVEE